MDIPTMSLIVQTTGVVGTLTAAFIGVRSYINANKRAEEAKKKEQATQELALKAQQQNLETRQAQLLMQIYQTFMSSELLNSEYMLYNIEFKNAEDYNKLLKDKDSYKAFIFYGSWLEGLGILVKNNLIDIHLIAELTSAAILWYWEKYHDGVMDCRIKLNWPRFFVEVEFLYDRLNEYGKTHPELGISSPKFG